LTAAEAQKPLRVIEELTHQRDSVAVLHYLSLIDARWNWAVEAFEKIGFARHGGYCIITVGQSLPKNYS